MGALKREIEVTLAEVTLTATGKPLSRTRHMLSAGLIWPRLGTARKSTALPVRLDRGTLPGAPLPWSQRVLFKEGVEGHFAFEVALTEALSDAAVEAFMRALSGHLLKLATGRIEEMEPPTLSGNLAALPLSYLAKTVLKERAPATLASGALDLDASSLPPSGQSVRWTIPLTASSAIEREKARRSARAARPLRQVIVPTGGVAGSVVVEALVL
ncbi:MAG: hypothetical protein PHR35_14385 [Kiritimatiellae bacterium]|nr:hypothetical protein [Kiritimatiellia bacterium]